jgi:hypothetical protein
MLITTLSGNSEAHNSAIPDRLLSAGSIEMVPTKSNRQTKRGYMLRREPWNILLWSLDRLLQLLVPTNKSQYQSRPESWYVTMLIWETGQRHRNPRSTPKTLPECADWISYELMVASRHRKQSGD